jgi:hypothetical protein
MAGYLPLRPDWRWARAIELGEHSRQDSVGRLVKEDRMTNLLFDFHKKHGQMQGEDFPEIFQAHDYFQYQVKARVVIEGYLMAGATDEEIAESFGCPPGVVKIYHDAFFAVRPYLHKPGWIAAAVFGGFPHKGYNPGDQVGLAHRIGWFGKVDLFDKYLSMGLESETLRKISELTRQLLAAHSPEIALMAGHRPEQAAEMLKLTIGDGSPDTGRTGVGSAENAAAVEKFVSNLPISVANPTEERNLSLPERELRSHEYEVVAAKE